MFGQTALEDSSERAVAIRALSDCNCRFTHAKATDLTSLQAAVAVIKAVAVAAWLPELLNY